jgi:hypothetical protein
MSDLSDFLDDWEKQVPRWKRRACRFAPGIGPRSGTARERYKEKMGLARRRLTVSTGYNPEAIDTTGKSDHKDHTPK